MTQARNKSLAKALHGTIDRPIVLVGLMGCGKSSVGKVIAPLLDLEFFDSDTEIENAAGMSIAEIFENYGEPEFRSLERRVFERLLDGQPKVIAAGGGAFVQDDTRAVIQEGSISIWLQAKLAVLVARTQRRSNRPILAGKDHRTVLRELMDKRRPAYEQATLRVFSGPESVDKTVRAALDALKGYFRS
ncbi:MAG: shikimate kinase [Alphaproteobacteria bacterium TMED89]|nr:shikimate kinase [Rhodospirillaceae bacterium]RPH16349.1 MAG: shikimate kinase [Alphaproteobacteria bacterium TMED89]